MSRIKNNLLSASASTIQRKRTMEEMIADKRKLREIEKTAIVEKLRKTSVIKTHLATSCTGASFYRSKEWKELRYRILVIRGNFCEACGRSPKDGAIIQVDHILPRYVYPEKAFDSDNLQILCKDCNDGKGTVDRTRWSTILRKKEKK